MVIHGQKRERERGMRELVVNNYRGERTEKPADYTGISARASLRAEGLRRDKRHFIFIIFGGGNSCRIIMHREGD